MLEDITALDKRKIKRAIAENNIQRHREPGDVKSEVIELLQKTAKARNVYYRLEVENGIIIKVRFYNIEGAELEKKRRNKKRY